jgi:CO/xanthine dehydrogenase FAD-binding subunit
MKPAPFKYYAPTSVEEALNTLDQLGYDGKIIAGGQSLVAAMNFRMSQPAALVDLNHIPELFYLRPSNQGGISMGTMTRASTVEHEKLVAERAPLVHEAMPYVAHPQVRNRGTFGGAVAHADPAGQAPALVMAMNANLLVRSKGKERWIAADDFFAGPFMSVMEPTEMLVEILFPPLPPHSGTAYRHVARQSGATSMVGCSTVVTLDDKGICKAVKIVLSSVGETPFHAVMAGKEIVGQKPSEIKIQAVAEAAAQEIDPGSDIHATADFRRYLALMLVRETLKKAFERARA